MPRASTTSDIFNALAEPRRRQIVELLAHAPHHDVSDLIRLTGLPQPAVSKHLAVLRHVGAVSVLKAGQHRLYRLNPHALKPVHSWVQHFEHLWSDHLDSIKQAAEQTAKKAAQDRANSN